MALLNGSPSLLLPPNPTPFFPAMPPLILRPPHCLVLHSLPPPPIFSPKPKPPTLPSTRKASNSSPQKYVYPDPIPEFARSETHKFRAELYKRLYRDREKFGGDLDKVVDVCSEIFSEFLLEEYGGPGTLLVEPFTDMLVALKERKLAGAQLAARAALLWAQSNVDQDWDTRTQTHQTDIPFS